MGALVGCTPVEQGTRPAGESGTSGGGDSGSSEADDGVQTETSGAPAECETGEEHECLCDDGLSLGTQTCTDGFWGACECGGSGDEAGSTTSDPGDGSGGESTTGGAPADDEVCYAGADGSYTTCFPLHGFDPTQYPAGYEYPDALGGDPNYRKPIAFIDLTEIDGSTMLAPNFRLDEIAQESKGRYAIVQPHAVDSLQDLRDAVGGIGVNSGYRSPDYNVGVGGATHSRHMYGDGFDLDPASAPLSTLEAACESHGGMLVEYTSHVHCDFRFDDVSTEFFGPPPVLIVRRPLPWIATIRRAGAVFWAPASGFDEGEPTRRWTALDLDGVILLEARGLVFAAPEGTAVVRVTVGAQVDLALEL